jgi:serine/threonine protein phosphatase PrpC
LRFEYACGQIQGKRSAQEDTVELLALPSGGAEPLQGPCNRFVAVVADGMGGHIGGRVASQVTAKAFLRAVSETDGPWADRMNRALLTANSALRDACDDCPDLVGMGSTLIGAVFAIEGVGWVSIGDSGLYLVREGVVKRLNEDHSFGAYLDAQASSGLITASEAASDRRRNRLFHALLGEPLEHFEEFAGFHALHDRDVLVLASDGLKTLDDSRIAALVVSHAQDSCRVLVEALLAAIEAVEHDRQDNASVVVLRVRANVAQTGTKLDAESISTRYRE